MKLNLVKISLFFTLFSLLANLGFKNSAMAFNEYFSSSILGPEWHVSTGIGGYSLTDNPGHLRYYLQGPRSHDIDGTTGFWNPSIDIYKEFSGTNWVLNTEITYHLKWYGTGSQIPHLKIISGTDEDTTSGKFVWIERGIDQAYNSNFIAGGINGTNPPSYFELPVAPDDIVINDWLTHTYWYRIERNGDNITVRYSFDGTTYMDMFTGILPSGFGASQKVSFDGLTWATAGSYAEINHINITQSPTCDKATYTSSTGKLDIPCVVVDGSQELKVDFDYYTTFLGQMFFRLNSAVPK